MSSGCSSRLLGSAWGKTAEEIYALWHEYAERCHDQSAIWVEFLEWYAPQVTPAAYSADCPTCLRGDAHSQVEHEAALKRVSAASAEDYECSDRGYEDACAKACGF